MNPHLQARDMLYDLDNHPAIGSPMFTVLQLLDLDIADVDKRGMTQPHKGEISIRYSPQNYRKFKKEFDEEYKEYTPEELKTRKFLIPVYVPYEDVYGESWKSDHIEYWGELPFVVYKNSDHKNWYDRTHWETCQGVSVTGRTFEEMIVKLGRKYKKLFGDFDTYDFLTDKEKHNHQKEEPFVPAAKQDIKGALTTVSNPKYIHLHPSTLNLRWARWFSKTDYGKKNWSASIKEALKNSEL
jgi:hypothetical protein